MYFADIVGTELVQILGVIVVILAGFYGFTYKLMRESRAERADERKAFITALEHHAKAQELVAIAIDKNTAKTDASINVSNELKDFLINLNGSLVKSVKAKQKEVGK